MEKHIDLMDLVRLYTRRWWALVIGLVSGGLIFFLVTIFMITPMYTSAGSLYTENSTDVITQEITNVNLNQIMVRKELVQTYAEVLSSNVFLKKVAEESGLGYTHSQLLRMISMSSKNETEILVISVKSANPEHAYIIAQTIIQLAEEQVSSVVKGGGVKVLDVPELNMNPSSPNVSRNIQIGMLIGLVVSVVIVFVVEMADNKVKDADQIGEQFKYPVLGEIPYFSATGKKVKKAPYSSTVGNNGAPPTATVPEKTEEKAQD